MYSDRHQKTEIVCEQCGKLHMVRVERIQKGQGRFCSLQCANKWQKENSVREYGKSAGKKYFDSNRKRWNIKWFSNDGVPHTEGYARWWWEQNKGEIPSGYSIAYKDGNYENLDPSNFEMILFTKLAARYAHKRLGIPKPSMQGENSRWWMGGRSYEYPLRFSKSLKRTIKTRDNYTCQCCYMQFSTHRLDVHHIDRNKENNTNENLVTVCKSCHRAIHGKENKVNDRILYFRSLLP